jgi:hypothetical protein
MEFHIFSLVCFMRGMQRVPIFFLPIVNETGSSHDRHGKELNSNGKR